MKKQITIRAMQKADLPAVKRIIEDNQMFPAEYLDEMAAGYLQQTAEELWFVAEDGQNGIIAIAYCAPERMTEGTWNVLLIAVRKQHQGLGVGAQLMAFVESELRALKVRIVLVETSGVAEYGQARAFYPKCGYKQVAVIPEYYAQGDDKIVFCKALTG